MAGTQALENCEVVEDIRAPMVDEVIEGTQPPIEHGQGQFEDTQGPIDQRVCSLQGQAPCTPTEPDEQLPNPASQLDSQDFDVNTTKQTIFGLVDARCLENIEGMDEWGVDSERVRMVAYFQNLIEERKHEPPSDPNELLPLDDASPKPEDKVDLMQVKQAETQEKEVTAVEMALFCPSASSGSVELLKQVKSEATAGLMLTEPDKADRWLEAAEEEVRLEVEHAKSDEHRKFLERCEKRHHRKWDSCEKVAGWQRMVELHRVHILASEAGKIRVLALSIDDERKAKADKIWNCVDLLVVKLHAWLGYKYIHKRDAQNERVYHWTKTPQQPTPAQIRANVKHTTFTTIDRALGDLILQQKAREAAHWKAVQLREAAESEIFKNPSVSTPSVLNEDCEPDCSGDRPSDMPGSESIPSKLEPCDDQSFADTLPVQIVIDLD